MSLMSCKSKYHYIIGGTSSLKLSLFFELVVALRLHVLDRLLYGLFGEHRAMHFDRWQFEIVGNIAIFDLKGFFYLHSLDQLGRIRTRSDS